MGSGASCTERPSTPLNERLRTMLIMRAYNCRPRDWTMKDQFDAAAEEGFLTKDNLRKALRLAECPRIEALLDRCSLFDPPAGGTEQNNRITSNASAPGAGSISVADLIAFVENSARHQQNSHLSQQQRRQRLASSCSDVRRPSSQRSSSLSSPLSPPSTLPTPDSNSSSPKRPGNLHHANKHFPSGTSGSSTSLTQPTARSAPLLPPQQLRSSTGSDNSPARLEPAGPSVDSNGVDLLSPRVVPLTSKWALSPSSAAADPKSFRDGATGTSTPFARADGRESASRQNSVSGSRRSEECMGQEGDAEEVSGSDTEASKRGGGHCTVLVRHLGAVLGLRGKEAYRRPGPGQPVWRKRETLIQERIVQYTTLDEEGTVQELFETEKSQTEVLHMECKRTGEFAHSESTHYESGEAFNGEVVLEETGVERYVHLRSVDDEYEHLESTLPSRARTGGAAGGVGGNPPAEGVESGPGENETGGDVNTVDEGGDNDERSAAGEEPTQGRNHPGEQDGRNVDGGSEHKSGTQSECSRKPQLELPEGVGNQGQTSSAPSFAPPEQQTQFPYRDDDAEVDAALPRREAVRSSRPAGAPFVETPSEAENAAVAGGTDDRRHPSPPPPSAYHYRSPSCSPRLSPRPMRSPYRQEGVGGRENSGRGEGNRRSGEQGERREEPEVPAWKSSGGEADAASRERHAGGSTNIVGERKYSGMVDEREREEKGDGGEEKGDARVFRASSGTRPCSPLLGPVPSRGDGNNGGATCSAQGGGGDDFRPEAWFETEVLGKLSATRVDALEGACVENGGGGLCGGGVEGAGLGEAGGFPDGYEGSVVFVDNQSHEGGAGQYNSSARADDGWWPPESGSVLRGVDFAFEDGDNVPAVHTADEEADAFLSRAEQPATSALPLPSPTTRPGSDDAGDEIDLSHLVDELRSGAPLPTASNPRDSACNNGDSEAAVERKSGVSPGSDGDRDQGPAAAAPFHSQDWDSKVTAAVPYEDAEEGKLARAGVATAAAASAAHSDHSSGPDVAA